MSRPWRRTSPCGLDGYGDCPGRARARQRPGLLSIRRNGQTRCCCSGVRRCAFPVTHSRGTPVFGRPCVEGINDLGSAPRILSAVAVAGKLQSDAPGIHRRVGGTRRKPRIPPGTPQCAQRASPLRSHHCSLRRKPLRVTAMPFGAWQPGCLSECLRETLSAARNIVVGLLAPTKAASREAALTSTWDDALL